MKPKKDLENTCEKVLEAYQINERCVTDWFEYDQLPFWKKWFTKKPKAKIFIKKY